MDEIGSKEEATAALRILRGQRDPRGIFPLPPGWSRVDQGTSRIVLRGPSGAVYKVPAPIPSNANWEDGIRHNRLEAERFAKWQREGRDFVTDEWHLYEVEGADGVNIPIMAMEFLGKDGSSPTNLDEMWAALQEVDAADRDQSNYGVRDGKAIIIDAGGAASPYTITYIRPENYGHRRVADGVWDLTDLWPEPERQASEPDATEPEPARWVKIVSGGLLFVVLVGAAVSLGRWFKRVE